MKHLHLLLLLKFEMDLLGIIHHLCITNLHNMVNNIELGGKNINVVSKLFTNKKTKL